MASFGRVILTVALAIALTASTLVLPGDEALAQDGNPTTATAEPGGDVDPGELTQDPDVPNPDDSSDSDPANPAEQEDAGSPNTDTDADDLVDSGADDAPAEEDQGGEPRGPNGGLASDSPGPNTARPAEEAPIQPFASAAGRGAIIGDDYPSKYRNLPWPYPPYQYIWDEWNFAYRQCTSFVSWRLNNANGVRFSNQYLGLTRWGDAGQWANSARSVGVRVDNAPEVGSVAWSGPGYGDASQFGHVAWVAQVLDNGKIVIEEYNNGWAGAYSVRTVSSSAFQGYIHIKDLVKPFTKTTKPTIAGAAMVGSTLTAKLNGWSPAPTNLRYQWKRNGTAIAGATGRSYQPKLADFAQVLSVEVTGDRAGYRAERTTSANTAGVLMSDTNGNGIDDTQEMLPWNSDVNGDGLPDVVGFGSSGVRVSLATKNGLGASKQWVSGFGTADGWSTRHHPRTLTDVNGDGKADVVGFASDGVYVSTSTGSGFNTMKKWTSGFGTQTGWRIEQHPRTLADVNGDGLPDVVGFANDGVYVALNTGTGFSTPTRWYAGFGVEKGWGVAENPRFLADMNGDGRADVVGISNSGVFVALSTGKGFATAQRWATGFNYNGGWRSASHPRVLADVNGDGLPDVVGFASDGVYVALNTGSGLQTSTRWRPGFGTGDGWDTGRHPRVLADVNGDGRADIVGFGETGVTVALSTGSSFSAPKEWSKEFAATSPGVTAWSVDRHPRFVTDMNGDGKADIVGFGDSGVSVAYSTGSGFGASVFASGTMGYSAGSWRVASHPRSVSIQTLVKRPRPTIAGTVRVGETVTATVGTWQPAPVKLSQQWLRDGKAITGQTTRSYTLKPEDAGTQLTFQVSATKSGFAKTQQRAVAQRVALGRLTTTDPKISGTLRAGSTLSVTHGTWGPSPVSLKYQWNRNGSPIKGATKRNYELSSADAGRRLSVSVTGTKTGYGRVTLTSSSVTLPGATKPPAKSPFVDVSPRHKFYQQIAWMHTTGLSTGTRTSRGAVYGPSSAVTREAMAAFLFRLDAMKTYEPPRQSPFIDVLSPHRFYTQIAWMYASGLSTGSRSTSGRVYKPSEAVSREAMAAFLYRLEQPKGYVPPRTSPFADVSTTHKFYREISWMYETGLSTGVRQTHGRPAYKPKDAVSREAMAAFLYRLETTAQ